MTIYNVVLVCKYDVIDVRFDDFDKALAFVSLMKGELNKHLMKGELNKHLKIEIHEITDKQVKKIYEYGND